jgi:hypothetical protein
VGDLLVEGWEEVVHGLGSGRGDAVCIHLLGRQDLRPSLEGDLHLVDSESGADIEVALDDDALRAYESAVAGWLDAVERACGRYGVAYARLADDEPVDRLVGVTLASLGVVA